jgi:replicative superfamily II helicase
MGHDPIISQVCDQADDFLAGVTKREEAKAGIAEFLAMHHAGLSATERQALTDQALLILGR